MNPTELKSYFGKHCRVTVLDRHGDQASRNLQVHDLTYVPLYGNYLIGDVEDICVDRILAINAVY